jgi:hypothetical protein
VAGERFGWRDLGHGDQAASSRRCDASAQADRDSPLAERGVYREEAIRIHYEDAGHDHEDTIKESRETAVPGHRQKVCRIRWKEGVRRESEETLGFPNEVIRRREERRWSGITEKDGGSLSPEKRRSVDESSGLAFNVGGPATGRRHCRKPLWLPATPLVERLTGNPRSDSPAAYISCRPGLVACAGHGHVD